MSSTAPAVAPTHEDESKGEHPRERWDDLFGVRAPSPSLSSAFAPSPSRRAASLDPGAAAPSPAPRAPAGLPGCAGVVLVVDDDVILGRALRRILDAAGFEVVVVASIAEARSAVSSGAEYAAVLCDLTLKDGSGATFVRWIRAQDPALGRRTIVLTGGAMDVLGHELVKEDLTEILCKPIDRGLLVERVRAATQRTG